MALNQIGLVVYKCIWPISCCSFATRATRGFSLRRQQLVLRLAKQFYDPELKCTRVPADFTVPDTEEWPVWAHRTKINISQFRIDYRRHALDPEIVSELDKIGFIWNMKEYIFEQALLGIKTYKEVHGDTLIPHSYVIPMDDPQWPRELWGKSLGKIVDNLRIRREYKPLDQIERLDEIGFVWNVQEYDWQRNMVALTTYKKIFGHTYIPHTFQVPHESQWPEDIWGLRLGILAQNIRSRWETYSLERIDELEELGFIPRVRTSDWNTNLSALKIYFKFHGNTNVPSRFEVPTDDPTWPKYYWGVKLGNFVHNTRSRKDFMNADRIDELEELGFRWRSKSQIDE